MCHDTWPTEDAELDERPVLVLSRDTLCAEVIVKERAGRDGGWTRAVRRVGGDGCHEGFGRQRQLYALSRRVVAQLRALRGANPGVGAAVDQHDPVRRRLEPQRGQILGSHQERTVRISAHQQRDAVVLAVDSHLQDFLGTDLELFGRGRPRGCKDRQQGSEQHDAHRSLVDGVELGFGLTVFAADLQTQTAPAARRCRIPLVMAEVPVP